jgi:hypothetical protein
MFLVFSSGIESIGNSSIFAFSLLLFVFIQISVLSFRGESFGVSNIFVAVFSDEPRRLSPLLPR